LILYLSLLPSTIPTIPAAITPAIGTIQPALAKAPATETGHVDAEDFPAYWNHWSFIDLRAFRSPFPFSELLAKTSLKEVSMFQYHNGASTLERGGFTKFFLKNKK
jgi:hypothetical protein